jgi:hypothetical protein
MSGDDDRPRGRRVRGARTTRRGLIAEALGLVSLPREPADSALASSEAAGSAGEVRYRSYREGVADLRRRERQAVSSPRPPRAVRTWREGAAAVAADERSSGTGG